MKTELDPTQHHKTKNARGFMHPFSEIGRKFVLFSKTSSPSMDIGCAYGNTVIAAIEEGAENVIACDMEQTHLDILREQLEPDQLAHLTTKQGQLPDGIDFPDNSIASIHASHILEYLKPDEVDRGLEKFFHWLKTGGKLFILCYTVHILELANQIFTKEYQRRIEAGEKWPGYLEDFNKYSYTDDIHNEHDTSAFPIALHMFDVPVFVRALKELGFIIEFAEYLDGRTNGAVEETWHDGREYVGIVACKP